MKAKEQGFILFTTLVILSCIVLIVLAEMQIILVFSKFFSQEKERQHLAQHLENAANKIINNSLFIDCIKKVSDANTAINKILQVDGCKYADDKYHYIFLVENLGEYPCLKIKIGDQVFSSAHLRLSIRVRANSETVLQLRFIRAVEDKLCEIEPRFIRLGVSSWRLIYAVDGELNPIQASLRHQYQQR